VRKRCVFSLSTFYAIALIIMGRDSVDKTQEEIVEEIAKSLGHSGDLLEGVLARLDELGTLLAGVEDVDTYNSLVDKFNDLRKEAVTRREMLMIHREAIGLWAHKDIDASYPIPPKKRKKLHNDKP
jgi:hypothetical protein